ncbi:MAG: sulfite exporter TauE/SafE family protein [Rubellimicrobium sp.]|nr:sulfite exporter TauE/SafE family protein [Rubellimicrobium sp.]
MDAWTFSDPWVVAAGILSAAIIGVAKGGLTGVGMLAVPVMALAISPVQAAGITLPILLISDAVGLWTWWKSWDIRTIRLMLPGAVAGTALGWATARYVSDDAVRLIVGVIAIVFFLNWLLQSRERRAEKRPHNPAKATFWATVTGYTSFISHAGGPIYQVYAIPLGLDPKTYTGTNVLFFAVTNFLKIVPYFLLGQLAVTNLVASAALMPVAVVFTFIGAWIIRRMSAAVFYPVTYALVAAVGVKLILDAVVGMVG